MAQPDVDGALVGGASLDGRTSSPPSAGTVTTSTGLTGERPEPGQPSRPTGLGVVPWDQPGDRATAQSSTDIHRQNGLVRERSTIGLQVVLVITSLLLTLLVLLHKGKGGGLSDMFGGGVTSSLGGSSVAERNLDRFTIASGWSGWPRSSASG